MNPRRPKSMMKASPVTTEGAIVGRSATTWKKRFPGIFV